MRDWMKKGMGKMMILVYGLMLLAGVALCVAVAARVETGTLTARWLLALPVYTLCMCGLVYLI